MEQEIEVKNSLPKIKILPKKQIFRIKQNKMKHLKNFIK